MELKDFMGGPGLIVLAVAAVVGFALLSFYLAAQRRKKLSELAASIGLVFTEDGPDAASLAATGIELFRAGRSQSAANVIRTAVPAGEISVFDYSYVTGSGKNRTTHNFTVGLVACAKLQVPSFDLKPETFIYKLGEVIGFKDIDLPAFPLFSDKYRLTGADEAAVHMFFTPDRAAWFERNLGLRVQGSRGHVVVFKREGRLPVEAWQGFIEEVKTFASEVLK
jgi:hypothetical protein